MKKKAKTISAFEFMEMFPDETSAREWFEKKRWGKQRVCPKCGGMHKIKTTGRAGSYWCGDCRDAFTVRTGTVMECSRVPIRKWLYAIYLVVTSRKSVSSLQLSKEISVTQKTAWFMLQRIREACGNDFDKLTGIVEVDETYFGGKRENMSNKKRKQLAKEKPGRGAVGKHAVLGMRERGGKTKAMPVAKTDGKTLQGTIKKHVEPGSVICTDEHRGYSGLGGKDYHHRTVKHSAKEYVNGMAHTNGIESVWALLKRGYTGTFHHFSLKHLQRYVDEFTFRLNEGACDVDTIDRINALAKSMEGKRLTYRDLVR